MNFTQNFTPDQFKAIEGQIKGFFKANKFNYNTNHQGKDIKPLKGSFNALTNILGFAYTSSGAFAGFWACNGVNVFSDLLPVGFNTLVGFSYSSDGALYAIFEDVNENQHLVQV